MPPAVAAKFTVGELAVLRIVGGEVRQHGPCDPCVDKIAARAGVCRRLTQNALRLAAQLGLLTVEERRRQGQRNLPNILRIVSREWLSWLAKAARKTGCGNMHPTDRPPKTKGFTRQERRLPPEGGRQLGQSDRDRDQRSARLRCKNDGDRAVG